MKHSFLHLIVLVAIALSLTSCRQVMAYYEFEKMKDEVCPDGNFRESDLYKFLEFMPKGADLHIHSGAMLPEEEYLQSKTGLTLSEFRDSLSMKARPDSVGQWDFFMTLYSQVYSYLNPCDESYFVSSFFNYAKHGVYHIEPRITFTKGPEEALELANTILKAQDKVRESYPEFSVSQVFTGLKFPGNEEVTNTIFENGLFLCENVKDTLRGCSDFIVGIDLAQEEDKSRRLTDYSSLISTTLQKNPELKISLHAGESLLADNDEIRSAIALGASRIGHSYNLYMHPELMPVMKKRDICIESCPVSNYTLGYCDDFSEHPVKNYIGKGIPVALCDDDPLFQEACPLTDDFFVAAYYWDLSLFQIKKLCKNSIRYSFLPDDRKEALMKFWKKSWYNYILHKNLNDYFTFM